MAEDCIFCKIVRRQATSSIVYEDEKILAFVDIRPVSEGHTLIIPKRHYVDVFDTPNELLANMYIVTKKVAVAVKKATGADGISVVQQNGKAAGQDIFHMHVHVIPRFEGKKMLHFNELAMVSREVLDEVAARIRKEL
jgi:histidine triad (HIT) family protein